MNDINSMLDLIDRMLDQFTNLTVQVRRLDEKLEQFQQQINSETEQTKPAEKTINFTGRYYDNFLAHPFQATQLADYVYVDYGRDSRWSPFHHSVIAFQSYIDNNRFKPLDRPASQPVPGVWIHSEYNIETHETQLIRAYPNREAVEAEIDNKFIKVISDMPLLIMTKPTRKCSTISVYQWLPFTK